MSVIINSVRGFKDLLPGEVEKWQFVEDKSREVLAHFGVREIRVPILEKTELFQRGIGETTDIVEKEMYTFVDKGHESLTLRPEATASVIRAYLQHSLHTQDPVARLFTVGPMFRRERPQRGRFRQFHQINVEFIGVSDAFVDAEIIVMLMHLLSSLGVVDLRLEINSLGCAVCRPDFRQAVRDFLKDRQEGLCEDCLRRMEMNPLRVFDCKVEGCRGVMSHAPQLLDFLCADCRTHFERVNEYLRIFAVPFTINAHMVRGLDYYTRTAFEVTTESLGAQSAVAGGGRYDRLIAELGGPDIPGIGFAIGMERLISLIPAKEEAFVQYPDIFIAAIGEVPRLWAFAICNYLRMVGIRAEMGYEEKSLKSQMKRSDKLHCSFTLIIGDREIEENRADLRDMKNATQEPISLDSFDKIAETILQRMSGRKEEIV
jgi:histidyl-tRNA synthetase